jgi:hypothetical protein
MSIIRIVINYPQTEADRYNELLNNFVIPRDEIIKLLLQYWSYLGTVPGEAHAELQSLIIDYMFDGQGREIMNNYDIDGNVSLELKRPPTVIYEDLVNHLFNRVRSIAGKVIPLVEKKVILQLLEDPHLNIRKYLIPVAITPLPFGMAVDVSLTESFIGQPIKSMEPIIHAASTVQSTGRSRWR